jgi:hypothetical protein
VLGGRSDALFEGAKLLGRESDRVGDGLAVKEICC